MKASALTATSGIFLPSSVLAKKTDGKILRVWSCGGLAEAFIPANKNFKQKTGVTIAYTGAFAAALGKSLLNSAIKAFSESFEDACLQNFLSSSLHSALKYHSMLWCMGSYCLHLA